MSYLDQTKFMHYVWVVACKIDLNFLYQHAKAALDSLVVESFMEALILLRSELRP